MWKEAVREALWPHSFFAPTRLAVEIEFRLDRSQHGRNAPDLDNLLKSTIEAFDGLLAVRPMRGRPQVDDERIDRIVASKRLAQQGEEPGATVVIWPLIADGSRGTDMDR